MTYAIQTAYIGPTNFRGSRIKARVMERSTGYGEKPRELVLHWDHRLSAPQNHQAAARALAEKLGWSGQWVEGASVWVNIMACADSFEV